MNCNYICPHRWIPRKLKLSRKNKKVVAIYKKFKYSQYVKIYILTINKYVKPRKPNLMADTT